MVLRRLRGLGLLLVFSVACSACTWPMFGFDPANTRFNPVVTPLNASTVKNMVLRGTAATSNFIQSSPATVAQGMKGQVTGTVYIASGNDLYAFPQFDGTTNCSGTPASCTPLWTAPTAGDITSSPAVANGVVYIGSADHNLYAFDATGSTHCSGTPKTCTPLWTGTTAEVIASPPTVVNGIVYVTSSDDKLYAFDATLNNTNCSGLPPKACAPLWTASGPGSEIGAAPAVANGVVYVAGLGTLEALDATGTTNCSGTPKTCSPLWTAAIGAEADGSAAVANGVVYVSSYDLQPSNSAPTNGTLWAFAASGTTNCSGTPKTCTPLWTAATGDDVESSPAVANGMVYTAASNAAATAGTVFAFDAAGTTHCSGTPKTCTPLWSASTAKAIIDSSPAIENGILFIGSDDHDLYAFDASGSMNCSGTPKTCTPLWSGATGGLVRSSPTPAGTIVYVGSGDGKLYAFGLP
jgi:outer membrane protein assembly factor BamB